MATPADRPTVPVPRLHEFVRLAWLHIESVPFIDNWHIGAKCEHLEAVTAGQIENLLINEPPGCSKSIICSVIWPAWEWARNAAVRWMHLSYDQALSDRDATRCRALIQSSWYQFQWPIQFRDDVNLKRRFETSLGGYRISTSIGGHATGEHPDRIVWDDPNDVLGAESPAKRREMNDHYDLVMPTRGISRGVRRVIIQQRTHELDLSGHVLLKERERYVHIVLPMRFETGDQKTGAPRMKATPLGWTDPRSQDGELLAPEQMPEAKVCDLEKRLGSYGTAGQLQQRPVPREGGMFKRDWFAITRALPARCQFIRYWDKAATEGDGDYTAGVLMAAGPDGKFYIVDVVHGQWGPGPRNRMMRQTADLDAVHYGHVEQWAEEEGGSSGKDSSEALIRLFAGHSVRVQKSTGSKEVRADPFAAQCEAGNVLLIQGDWNPGYLEELSVFPNGAHDDQVDASSGAFNLLASSPGYEVGQPQDREGRSLLDDMPERM